MKLFISTSILIFGVGTATAVVPTGDAAYSCEN